MTIQELADRARLSADYIGKLELGKQNPTIDSLVRVAAALGTNLNAILIDLDLEKGQKHEALVELNRFASQFSADEIHRMMEILKAVHAPR